MRNSSPPPRPVLLYDRECRFCRFAARSVARLDRRHELALLPLQDDAAAALLAALEEDERLATWRIVQLDGSLIGYGAGIADLLAAMRLTRPLGRLVARVPDGAFELLYRAVAQNRATLGRLVPDGSAPRRYP